MKDSSINILLVEDDPEDLEIIQNMILKNFRRTVGLLAANTLGKGLKCLTKQKFDIILIDLGLPDSQGLETLTKLLDHVTDVPIIVLTGLNDELIGIEAVKAGAQDYLIKGEVDDNLLTRAIKYAIERKGIQKALLKSIEKLKAIFEGAYDGILAINTKTMKFGFANPRICEITGYSIKRLLKLDLSKIIPKNDFAHVYDLFRRQINGDLNLVKDIPILRNDKNIVYCDVNSKIVQIDNKEYLVGFFRDITENKMAEEQVKRSEEKFRTLFETSPMGIAIIDINGNLIDCNKEAMKITGLKKDELIGKQFMNFGLYDEDGLENIIELFSKALTGEEINNFQLSITVGNQKKCVEIFPTPLKKGNDIYGFQIIVRDISERKHAEVALQNSEERYRALFEKSNASITIMDKSGVIVDCNKATEDLTGYSKNNIIGKSFEKLLTLDMKDLPELMEKYDDVIKGKDIGPYELKIINKKGGKRWVNVIISRILKDKETVNYQIITSDITERKRAEEALKNSEEKYRDLVENINDAIYATDENGMITYVSPVIESISGYTADEVMGKSFTDFIHEEDLPSILEIFPEVLAGKLRPSEYRIKTKSGKAHWIRTSSKPVVIDGNLMGLKGVMNDVNEQKRAEDALKKKTQKLERFSTLMVGREKKMMELKTRIKELEEVVSKNNKLKI